MQRAKRVSAFVVANSLKVDLLVHLELLVQLLNGECVDRSCSDFAPKHLLVVLLGG